MFTGIHTVILYVSDISISKKFYISLGFQLVDDEGEYVSLKASSNDRVLIALNSTNKHRMKVGCQTIIINSKNIENIYKQIKDEVKVTMRIKEKPWGKTFIFEDPDGNKIEVLQE